MGAVAAEQGRLEEAIKVTQQALKKAEQLDDRRLIGEQYSMLALAYRDLGQIDAALDYCQKAVDAFHTIDLKSLEENAMQLHHELLALAALD